jgi:hypothetical protein
LFSFEESRREGQKKAAKNIFLVDGAVRGRVVRRVPNSSYGFVNVVGRGGMPHRLFVLFRDMDASEGEIVECSIDANEKGPVGVNPVRVRESDISPEPDTTEELPDLGRDADGEE